MSDSPAPTGVKAFYIYMKKEMDGKVWSYSPDLLSKSNSKQLLVIVEPFFTPDQQETGEYIDFMEAGNTIVLLKNNPQGMFGLKTGPYQESPSTARDSLNVVDQHSHSYEAEIHSTIRLLPNEKDQILLKDSAGAVALKRNYGKGQLITTIAPEWLTNEKLLNYDHLPLVLNLVKEGNPESILFDEYLHTGKNKIARVTVYPMWFLLLLFQGILLTSLWLWLKGKRFGPIYTPREESIRFSDEGIQALTAWYLRGKRYQDSIRIQADYVKQMLQEQWRIPYSTKWKDSIDVMEKKWKQMSRREISSFLNDLEGLLEKEKISRQEYLLWSRKLDRLREEVDEG